MNANFVVSLLDFLMSAAVSKHICYTNFVLW